MNAEVDIVIPVFNGMPYLRRAVASALGQSFTRLRVTVVDNASTDGTWEWLKQLEATDQRLRLIRNSENIGMIPNMRKSFDVIEAERYCFLCADDMLFSRESIAVASGIMNADSLVGAVYSDMAYIDTTDRVLLRRRVRREGAFSALDVGRESIMQGRNLFGIPVLAKKSLIPKHAFDGSLVYTADIDMALEMGERSTSWYHPETLIANRYHGRNATGKLHRTAEKEFHSIALRHGFSFSAFNRMAMKFLHARTRLLKDIFLLYAGWSGQRSASRHGGSHGLYD